MSPTHFLPLLSLLLLLINLTQSHPIYGLNDLYLGELPPSLSFSPSSPTSTLLSQANLTRTWTLSRLTQLSSLSSLSHCRPKAICQTAKYLRKTVPFTIRLSCLLNLPPSTFATPTDRSVWMTSLRDSAHHSFCDAYYDCGRHFNVNFVPEAKLGLASLSPSSRTLFTAKSNPALSGFLLETLDSLAYGRPSDGLPENCRVSIISKLARFLAQNMKTAHCEQCLVGPKKMAQLVLGRLGRNKFSEAWISGNSGNAHHLIDSRYPCEREELEDSVRIQMERLEGKALDALKDALNDC